jgi:hypothetical protein
MRRLLSVIAILAGLTWGGMFGWAINSPHETQARADIRTTAFAVMIVAGMIGVPSRRGKATDPPHEERL